MVKAKQRQIKKECQILTRYLTVLLHLGDFTAARMELLGNIVQKDNIDLQTEQGVDLVRGKVSEIFGIKSAMLLDTPREMDYLIWTPLEILYCMAYEFTAKYRKSIALFPEIASSELTEYINSNGTFLRNAVKELRDDIAHPERGLPISQEYIGKFFNSLPDAGRYHEAKVVELLMILRRLKVHLLKYV